MDPILVPKLVGVAKSFVILEQKVRSMIYMIYEISTIWWKNRANQSSRSWTEVISLQEIIKNKKLTQELKQNSSYGRHARWAKQ